MPTHGISDMNENGSYDATRSESSDRTHTVASDSSLVDITTYLSHSSADSSTPPILDLILSPTKPFPDNDSVFDDDYAYSCFSDEDLEFQSKMQSSLAHQLRHDETLQSLERARDYILAQDIQLSSQTARIANLTQQLQEGEHALAVYAAEMAVLGRVALKEATTSTGKHPSVLETCYQCAEVRDGQDRVTKQKVDEIAALKAKIAMMDGEVDEVIDMYVREKLKRERLVRLLEGYTSSRREKGSKLEGEHRGVKDE